MSTQLEADVAGSDLHQRIEHYEARARECRDDPAALLALREAARDESDWARVAVDREIHGSDLGDVDVLEAADAVLEQEWADIAYAIATEQVRAAGDRNALEILATGKLVADLERATGGPDAYRSLLLRAVAAILRDQLDTAEQILMALLLARLHGGVQPYNDMAAAAARMTPGLN